MTGYVITTDFKGETWWLAHVGNNLRATKDPAAANIFPDAGYARYVTDRRNARAKRVAERRGIDVAVWRVAERKLSDADVPE